MWTSRLDLSLSYLFYFPSLCPFIFLLLIYSTLFYSLSNFKFTSLFLISKDSFLFSEYSFYYTKVLLSYNCSIYSVLIFNTAFGISLLLSALSLFSLNPFPIFPLPTPLSFFKDKIILKNGMKFQGTLNSQKILKKYKVGRLMLPNLKTYNKVTVIKMVLSLRIGI